MEKSRGDFILPSTAEIIERIKLAKGLRSDGDVARALGIKPQTLATSKMRSSIPFEAIIGLCDREGYSLDFLVRGVGAGREEALKVKEPSSGPQPDAMVPIVEAEDADGLSEAVSRGHIKDYFPFSRGWLKKIAGGKEPDKLVLLRARGQAMQPTINNGDLALVNLGHNTTIKNDAIYVVRAPDGGILIKRLVATAEGLLYISDNKAFDTFEIKKKPAEPLGHYVLGRVFWVGRQLL
ncbi:MAG: helix-turn-helix domain-containing protein [Actinomycetota bacterium]|nr:helix-turn-helix domain-containing protein [Actinomycetota bacterium]